MDGWVVYAIAIIGTAVLLALARGWWFGLPASIAATLVLLLLSIDNLYVVAGGPLIAAVSGARLPPKDQKVAVPAGIVLSAVFLFVVPSGPDSPLNFIVAACGMLFSAGALTGWLVAVARRKVRKGQISTST